MKAMARGSGSLPYKRIGKRLSGQVRLTTDAATSARMARVRQRGTTPELLVRRATSALGLRYRVSNRDLPGSPDLANRSRRWAIFVHGCFWHHHEGCPQATTPKSNRQFWVAKFRRNAERDQAAEAALRQRGYRVLTLWQCEAESPQALKRLMSAFQCEICDD